MRSSSTVLQCVWAARCRRGRAPGGGPRESATGRGLSYNRHVAYDQDLAERIRELLADEVAVTEMKMFGGLAFLIGGHMAIAASGEGGALVRVDPAASDGLVAQTGAEVAVMKGRAMDGWLRVDSERLRTKRQLAAWVDRGSSYARSLPPKKSKSKR